jgi:hypothetical protein
MTTAPSTVPEFKLFGPDGAVIAQGSLSAVTQPILGSRSRAEALAIIARADRAAEQERAREQREQEIVSDGIRVLADGINKLDRRLDAIIRSRAARRKLDAASEATAKMLAFPKDAPADHTPQPSGELHALEPKDPSEHQPAATDASRQGPRSSH